MLSEKLPDKSDKLLTEVPFVRFSFKNQSFHSHDGDEDAQKGTQIHAASATTRFKVNMFHLLYILFLEKQPPNWVMSLTYDLSGRINA